jgi:hypothetical protein
MPKGKMFTAAYDIRNILAEIVVQCGVERGKRRLVVHADNARPHPAKVIRAFCDDFLRIASHPHPHPHPHSHSHSPPPYSPDLTPSGFFLFLVGHLKNHLQGQQFRFACELLSGVRKILDKISVGTLEVVFRE